MKKALALCLSISIVLSLVGCSSGSTVETKTVETGSSKEKTDYHVVLECSGGTPGHYESSVGRKNQFDAG